MTLNPTQQFIIYKLERRPATLSTLAFDTGKTEKTIKFHISELQKEGFTIKEQAGWYSLTKQEKNS